jgi:hypothetical protein
VLKKRRKPNRGEKQWWLGAEKIQVIKEIKYLAVVLTCSGKRNKERNR